MPIITLNQDEVALLNEPITGRGGFQSLLATFRQKVQPGGELELTDEEIAKIRQYRNEYGDGGWQERLDKIFGRTLGSPE